MTSRSRVRKSAAAATAVAASAALLAGATLGPTAVQSAQSERTLVADPTLSAATQWAWGGGTAFALAPYVPILSSPGDATAIAVLPGGAVALATEGESATAFSIVGLAVAATDGNFLGIPIPTGQASCIGILTFANSSTDGACLNILGTLDADYNKNSGEVSAALTNPFKLVGLLTGDVDPLQLIADIASGESISRAITDDFVRLTLGGPGFVKLTSDYGFEQYDGSGGGVVIGWLGGKVVLFPVVTGGGVAGNVNYIGLPQFDFAGFPDIGNIIPSLSFGKFKTPIPGVEIPAWSTGDILGSTSASTTELVTVSETGSTSEAKTLSAGGSEATSTAPEPAPIESAPVVPETQPEPEVEPVVTPDPVDPPAAVESTPEVETPSETESAGETSSLNGVA